MDEPIRILRAAGHRRMPWKNGGGETTEIAVFPPGAGVSDFDWRISMAQVAGGGPFSSFPGIERTLSILEGEGLRLSIAGRAATDVTRRSPPLSFAADLATGAELIGGPVTDLNVMTRRGRFTHAVSRFGGPGAAPMPAAGEFVLFCHEGTLEAGDGSWQATLRPLDALLCSAPGPWHVSAGEGSDYFLITLRPG